MVAGQWNIKKHLRIRFCNSTCFCYICLHVSSVFDPLAGELSIKKILKEYIVSGRTIALIFLGQFIFAKNYFIHMIFYARMKTGASKDIYIYMGINQSIAVYIYIYLIFQ